MILENRLNITNQIELARAEEKISKQKAKQLFDSKDLNKVEVGTFKGLCFIHNYLFSEIYDFAGNIRKVNISKDDFRFAPLMYLEVSLKHIDSMPQSNFDEIIEKYVEMNISHPFREGNGRVQRFYFEELLFVLGYDIKWPKISQNAWIEANIAGVHFDLSPLEKIFAEAMSARA